jgi:hypothetical protein
VSLFLSQDLPFILLFSTQDGRRFKACVAKEIATSNGYCTTKKLHYYGVKLHLMGQYTKKSMPVPMNPLITNAGMGDIKVWDGMENISPEGLRVFDDKAYQRRGISRLKRDPSSKK